MSRLMPAPPIARPVVTFDEASHTYKLDGRRAPGITEILRESRLMNEDEYAFARPGRGRAIHELTAEYDRGELVDWAVEPEYRAPLDAWIAFRREMGFEPFPEYIETPLGSMLGFCGMPDRIGIMRGRVTIPEIKTYEEEAWWWGLQTAAQTILYCEQPGAVAETTPERLAVVLRRDGRYRCVPHRERSDFHIFKAGLTCVLARYAHE